MDDKLEKYHGGKLSEVVINSLKPFLEKIKLYGIKKTIEVFIPEVQLDKFVVGIVIGNLFQSRSFAIAQIVS